jgi:transcriptional regulator with XRE-family HTH domain
VPETPDQVFGQVIREVRVARGLSQEALSFACGRHRTFISLVERGRTSPSLKTIFMLSGALDVAPSELLASVEARKPRLAKSS